MRLRSYFLAAGAVAVVVGGVHLWRDAQGSKIATPSAEAVAEAQARHAKTANVTGAGERMRRPGRRDGDVKPPDPALAFPPSVGLPQPRNDLPGSPGPPPLTDRIRAEPFAQPPIDPDNPEVASAMTETNKLYDRGDYDGARSMAFKLLTQEPGNIRMMRVVVSSSCILGEAEVAEKYWSQLPPQDQAQMSIRCARYQVSFPAAGATTPTEK